MTARVVDQGNLKEVTMKGIVAYMLGIPLVVIILLYMTNVF
jgi:hypothetical protein